MFLLKRKKNKKIFLKLGKCIYIHKGLIPVLFLSFMADMGFLYLTFLLFALCHELSHLLAAFYLNCKTAGIKILPYGFALYIKKIPQRKRSLIFLAGPLVSGILGILFYYTGLFYFAKINFMLFFINLLPALPLDGGHLFYSLHRQFKITKRASAAVGTAFLCLAFFSKGFLWGIPIYFLIFESLKRPPSYIFVEDLVKSLEKNIKIK